MIHELIHELFFRLMVLAVPSFGTENTKCFGTEFYDTKTPKAWERTSQGVGIKLPRRGSIPPKAWEKSHAESAEHEGIFRTRITRIERMKRIDS